MPSAATPVSLALLVALALYAPVQASAAAHAEKPVPVMVAAVAAVLARQGQSGDTCSDDDDCRDSRKCVNSSLSECSSPSEECRCLNLPLETCDKTDECPEGEICAEILPDVAKTCLSKTAADDVCVDARALEAFESHQLVFEKHRAAFVLCDQNDSCATPGHMVVYNGQGMMMKKYCQMVSCTRKMMWVNSPKYQRALRVKSRTEGLEYSVFAARYQTQVEHVALSTAIHLGL